jgi:HD-GYP domain-containing protein (c-di-GMP phosphodiesterase class II)
MAKKNLTIKTELYKATQSSPEIVQNHIKELQTQIENLAEIGYNLGATKELPKLLNTIMMESMRLTNCDAGTLYLRSEDDRLRFEIMKTNSMGVDWGGISDKPMPDFIYPVKLYLPDGTPNHHMIAAYVGLTGETVNLEDAYESKEFDFSGTKAFDEKNGYRSKSFLTIPMRNHENDIIGVLQLLNAQKPHSHEIISFDFEKQKIIESLASQAAVAITNMRLVADLENLLESFIQLIADAIDKKSEYTGGHCARVPTIAKMLAVEVHKSKDKPFENIEFSDEDMRELHIASWLHDIGKITTPEYVVDKSTKLETIYDRINEAQMRFEVLKRDLEIEFLKKKLVLKDKPSSQLQALEKWYKTALAAIEDDWDFIKITNTGGEFMSVDKQQRVDTIALRQIIWDGKTRSILDEEWVSNLKIAKGTLNPVERKKIEEHISVTIDMLEKLPFPKNLRRVPEFAGGHHETMIGTGYPRGLKKEDMSIQARIMGIADIFEALTAADRPYKKGKTLSEAIRIMGFFQKDQHIDDELFKVFLKSGIHEQYANEYLAENQIDTVDIAPYLN